MNSQEQEAFWNALGDLHDNKPESLNRLNEVVKLPDTLCRFRSVNEQSLQQLSENKLYFSSADHYDDPFDTYIHININQMIPIYKDTWEKLFKGDITSLKKVEAIATSFWQNPDNFVNNLIKSPIDFSKLKGQLMNVRNSIQKRMFSICFCEDPYNETLWLKYANNYKGFVQIYDCKSSDTFLCGQFSECQNCNSAYEKPYIYPVYYSDEKYDATKFALGVLILDNIGFPKDYNSKFLYDYVQNSIMWDFERCSLIKKKCHEYDQEWRMIRPAIFDQRSCIKMKSSKIIIGLRTPQYERKLIVSAATIAGIKEIHELYINDSDNLDSRPVDVDNIIRVDAN